VSVSRPAAGFTLLEVLVALAITASGIAAMTAALGGRVDRAAALEARVMGEWLASNRLAELRISRAWPPEGEYTGQAHQGDRPLYYVEQVSNTDDPDLRRVDVRVYADEARTRTVATLFGYLSRQRVPG